METPDTVACATNDGAKGLQADALGFLENAAIGLASTAPAYSLAVTLGAIVAAVGVHAPALLLLALVPNLCIVVACDRLNRRRPDCGATFTWTWGAFGPRAAWITAWAMLSTDVIVMATFAGVAAHYSLLLIGAEGAADDLRWLAGLGVVWVAILTWLSLRKIQASALAQSIWVGVEVVALIVFAVVALVRVGEGNAAPTHLVPDWSWFDPRSLEPGDAGRGMLAALFMYWGWDTAFAVNEETARADRNPGRAAALATFFLAALYVLVSIAALAFAGVGPHGLGVEDPRHKEDVFAALARLVLGSGPIGKLLLLATLSSAVASAQTTILPAARLMLSMGAHRALPRRFATMDRTRFTPTVATLTIGVVSTTVYLALVGSGRDVLDSSINAISALIAFYYAMTGFACVWTFRRSVLRSFPDLLFQGLLPLAGALSLSVALVASVADLAHGDSGRRLLWGIGYPLAILLMFGIAGALAMVACNVTAPGFFRRRT